EIVISRYQRETVVTIRGPETRATPAHAPSNAEFTGIIFRAGVFMPKFPASMVMDRRDLNLPQAGSNSFWLDSSALEFPNFQNATFFALPLGARGVVCPRSARWGGSAQTPPRFVPPHHSASLSASNWLDL